MKKKPSRRKRRQSRYLTKTDECGRHRPYATRAEASAKASWHLLTLCRKCRAGRTLNIYLCLPGGRHWHLGHRGRYFTQREEEATDDSAVGVPSD